MNQQTIIETFFYMLGQFAFEKAKIYIEAKKDALHKASPSSIETPFVSLLATFSQLAEAEKCYHNQSFFLQTSTSFLPPRNLLRKERGIKDVYEDIRSELQKIEARPKQDQLQSNLERKLIITDREPSRKDACKVESSNNNHESSVTSSLSKPKYGPRSSFLPHEADSCHQQQNFNRCSTSSLITSHEIINQSGSFVSPQRSKFTNNNNDFSVLNQPDQSPNKYFTLSPLSWLYNGFKPKTPTSPADKGKINQQPRTHSSAARRLFCDNPTDKPDETSVYMNKKIDSTHETSMNETKQSKKREQDETLNRPVSPIISTTALHYSPRQVLSPIGPNYTTNSNNRPVAVPPNSLAATPIAPRVVADFSEELMSHFCLQLQYYTQARLELIGIYGKLYNISNKKHLHVDGISLQLSIFCRRYQKYFHHPLLAPIKEGMTLECEVLVTLIKAIIDIQHCRFLPSVFDLQEAQQKLNYWATNTFNKEPSKRRFNIKAQAIPRLYDWMCKLREFLVAKFTVYFHTTLYRNLPHSTIKNTYTKLSIDFHQRLSHFQRKVDALFIALLIDVSNEKDYRGQGYHFAKRACDQPKTKSSLQIMVITPMDARPKLDNLLADLYVIVVSQSDNLNGGHYHLFDPAKQMTFFLTKPDPHVILVTALDGQKSEREAMVKAFMIDTTHQLSGNRMILSLNNINNNLPSK